MSKCCENRDCTSPSSVKKRSIVIDFLYLDLTVCDRCQGTDKELDAALLDVSSVLGEAGFEVILNKVNIISKELAKEYRFESSPTILVNGRDIAGSVKESSCTSCADLCGDSVNCRVWTYQGEEYTSPPKELIINGILKAVYGKPQATKKTEYRLPQNLDQFFSSIESKKR